MNMDTNVRVVRDVEAWHLDRGARIAMDCTLTFDPDDPFAVGIRINRKTTWKVSRDLVIGGLDSWKVPVGEGDFQAWTVDRWGRPMLRTRFRVKAEGATFDLRHRQVAVFIHDTRMSVPQAAEPKWTERTLSDDRLAEHVTAWQTRLGVSPRCPVCKALDCLNAYHARVREEIRADRALDLQIDATDD